MPVDRGTGFVLWFYTDSHSRSGGEGHREILPGFRQRMIGRLADWQIGRLADWQQDVLKEKKTFTVFEDLEGTLEEKKKRKTDL